MMETKRTKTNVHSIKFTRQESSSGVDGIHGYRFGSREIWWQLRPGIVAPGCKHTIRIAPSPSSVNLTMPGPLGSRIGVLALPRLADHVRMIIGTFFIGASITGWYTKIVVLSYMERLQLVQ